MTAPNTALLSLREASDWASRRFGRDITTSNISYLLQYGRIEKHGGNGAGVRVSKEGLKNSVKRALAQRFI